MYQRAEIRQEESTNPKVTLSVWCISMIVELTLLTPSIAAIVIGSEYKEENSTCYGPSYYIALPLFLIIPGAIRLGHLVFFTSCCNKKDKTTTTVSSGFMLLFNLVWACIGLHMYYQQMSDQCHTQTVAKMIYAWCIIQLVFTGLYVSLFCCFWMCFCISELIKKQTH